MHPEQQYLDLLTEILDQYPRPDRTGTGTRSVFGRRMEFDLADGFPLFTTKRLPFKTIANELLWMISGSTNVKDLQARGVGIWDEWADQDGDLGPVYGHNWRQCPDMAFGAIDQLGDVLEALKTNPYSRRHIVNAWNVAQIEDMALPPCHMMFQYYVESDDRLSLQLYQRSADAFLGLPFNIASYALLLRMTAHMLGRKAGRFIWTGGDVHLYENHLEQAGRQIKRKPFELPKLMCGTWTDRNMSVPGEKTWEDWDISKVDVLQYSPYSHIAGAVSV
jgi:thymidylate synthase